ncbi:MAG: PilN domain-containing protein [Desulfomonile tiedjei]|nr:PilN domain-containing protein [Desulfomonile tiedjei]
MVRINLLPIRGILRRRELKQFIIIAASALGLAVLVMVGCYLYLDWWTTDLQTKQTQLQGKLNALKEKNKKIGELLNEITRLQKQVDTIQKLTKTRDTPAPFLGAVSVATPDEVWISGLIKQGQSFSLDGTGADNTVVVNFVHQLQRVKKGFSKAKPFIDKANKEDQTFFSDVKLIQIVSQSKPGGLASVQFKITGTIR